MSDGGHIVLKDEKGPTATITIPNVRQSNGVIQVIDSVLLPNLSGPVSSGLGGMVDSAAQPPSSSLERGPTGT